MRLFRQKARPDPGTVDRASERDAGIHAAAAEGQHSLTDIAKVVALSITRVSRIVRRIEDEAV
jgi:DNA-binding Lrp family transcriptional regulator